LALKYHLGFAHDGAHYTQMTSYRLSIVTFALARTVFSHNT